MRKDPKEVTIKKISNSFNPQKYDKEEKKRQELLEKLEKARRELEQEKEQQTAAAHAARESQLKAAQEEEEEEEGKGLQELIANQAKKKSGKLRSRTSRIAVTKTIQQEKRSEKDNIVEELMKIDRKELVPLNKSPLKNMNLH